MKLVFLLIIFISTFGFCQNSESYFAIRLTEDLYEHFDSSGVLRMEYPDTCECGVEISSKAWMFAKRIDAYDSLLLNELADDWLIDDLLNSLIKEFKKRKFDSKESISHIYIETSIIPLSNRFNIFRWKRKATYRVKMTIYYKPVIKNEKKEN